MGPGSAFAGRAAELALLTGRMSAAGRGEGGAVAPELAAAIGRRSRGNPFFVGELAQMTDSEPGALPDAVRDTVLVRLHGLSVACRDALGAAAVLGAAVDPAAVAGREAAAGIVAAGSFSHDVIREVARLSRPTADAVVLTTAMRHRSG